MQQTNNVYAPPTAPVEPTTKACQECGASINKKAEICPKCGVRQKDAVSKTALLLITFFLGGIGCHKFYLRKPVQGVFYLLFFWTYIPAFIALIEFLIYACTSSEKLNEKYEAGSAAVVAIAGAFGVFFFMGILAAIAIPAYQDYSVRARTAGAINEANGFKQRVDEYFVNNGKLPETATDVPNAAPVQVPSGATVTLEDNGVVVVRFNEGAGLQIAGQTLALVPSLQDGGLAWTCTFTGPGKYVSPNCRNQPSQ